MKIQHPQSNIELFADEVKMLYVFFIRLFMETSNFELTAYLCPLEKIKYQQK